MTRQFLTLLLGPDCPVIRYLGDGRVIWWDRDENNKPHGHALLACLYCGTTKVTLSGETTLTTAVWNCEMCGSERLSIAEMFQVCPWCAGGIEAFTNHTKAETMQECLKCDWIGRSHPAKVKP